MEALSLMDVILIACGLYTLYSTWQMKKTGDLKRGWLVSNDINPKKAKDITGYIGYMVPRTFVLGGLTVLYGIVGLVSTNLIPEGINVWESVMTIVFGVALVWFVVISTKARKRFL